MSHKPHYPTGTILQSIGELNSLPFNREDVYEVIKEHPGLSTREILSFLGLAVSTHQDKQRLGGFLRNIKSAAEKLQKEGRIIIEDRVDRYQYYPILEKKLEAVRNE